LNLQEIIARGRFIFAGAPKRFEVFKQVNGHKSAKEIAKKVGKSLSTTLKDLQKIRDVGLIAVKKDPLGKLLKKENSLVYEKIPLVKQIPISYFKNPIKSQKKIKSGSITKYEGKRSMSTIAPPSETEILEICREGETQIYEFKAAGTDITKLTKEVAAMINTKMGGVLFYGVEDDGTIDGTDKTSQELDQRLQNSLKNNIAPSPVIKIIQKDVLGQKIQLIIVPPWNKKDVYHFKGKVLIRKGTNVFGVTPEESKKLHHGKHVI
jgi:hypothetical protein